VLRDNALRIMVSIPLISGHQSGPIVFSTPSRGTTVSIPLISGHQSGPMRATNGWSVSCLNPFDIRASVRTPRIWRNGRQIRVSIPLISGHQSGRRLTRSKLLKTRRLNSFDIRASVRTLPRRRPDDAASVSIPLISGHQSGQTSLETFRSIEVSIPLISGHQSGPIGSFTRTVDLASQSL